MPETGQRRGSILDVCKICGQPLPDPMDRISVIMEKLRKETGFGEKPEK